MSEQQRRREATGRWEVTPDGRTLYRYACTCGQDIRVWSESGAIWDHWQHGEGEALLTVNEHGGLSERVPVWLARVHAYEGIG